MVTINYKQIVSIKNLLLAWNEFERGKKKRKDVQKFGLHLMDNIFSLNMDLRKKVYVHGIYESFNISDPKPRNIHKASVRDRLLHHAIYRVLYPYFDTKFIHDSYSCRKWKGTHRAIKRFNDFARKASINNTKTLWILKCDIRKFFASIDHGVLINILKLYDLDINIIWLLERIIVSFSAKKDKGLPLGNLTSQLLVNIYMDWFDQYMKHGIHSKYYIRYADDFVVMSRDRIYLETVLVKIKFFLKDNLLLDLYPDKVFVKTFSSGVDFLGWVNFPHHKVLRTATKKRMFRNLANNPKPKTLQSYLGMLKHGNTYELKKELNQMKH